MIKQPKIWLVISMLTILISISVIGLIRPTWGIDFTGGSLLEIASNDGNLEKIRDVLANELNLTVSVQTSENNFLIRTEALDETRHQEVIRVLKEHGLLEEQLRFESIGPTIGEELRQKAVTAIIIVVVILIAYLAYTFRAAAGLISSWKFGVAAIYALVHDLLIVSVLFVILGRVYGVVIDTLFVTAMLAILGYSVNDTIVVFNRLKTDWLTKRSGGFLDALNEAVKASLVRSLNTSLTTLLVLTALIVFGGISIRWFVVALAAGTIVGTYSSLFVAPPFLYYLAKRK